MAEVVLEHISKAYAGVQAVRDLSLRVADGELVVLVGPSGCGKTTTLRLIAGLEEPTSGSVAIGGRNVNRLPARARNVAMVFQRPALYPHMNVRHNLAFNIKLRQQNHGILYRARRLLRLAKQQQEPEEHQYMTEHIAQTAKLIGLESLLERYPGQLSGGQQQRVALGRAIVRRPEVFLLDEPLSHLDGQFRAELRHELHLLQRHLRATMIYVTHDQAEAMTLADRVAVMDRGVLQQVDRPLAVYDKPCNRFVAGFLGWPTMNFAAGRLTSAEGRLVFSIEEPGFSALDVLPVPKSRAAAWAALTGRPLTLGIRPESIGLAESGAAESHLAMKVVLIESLGHATLLTLEREGWQVTARVAAWSPGGRRQEFELQRSVEVFFQVEHAHLFDRTTGLTLSAPANVSGPAG
jgi:multiple sugar transport system ATP-binding protein